MNNELRVFFLQNIWVDNGCLMPKEFITLAKVFWKILFCLFLEVFSHITFYGVPKFTFPLVNIING